MPVEDISNGSSPNTQKTTSELLTQYAGILEELRRRKVVRTANAPAGDYAEYLVAEALPGQLAGNSEKSWDIRASSGERVQVKSRIVAEPSNRGQRQLSPFRSFDFDTLVVVLFRPDYSVWRAVMLPAHVARERSVHRDHVNGDVLFAVDSLFTHPEAADLTAKLRTVTEVK